MSGKKLTGIILVILGLIGSYYYIGGYLEVKNQFGNVFGMADEVLDKYLPMMFASVAFLILGIVLIFNDNEEENNSSNTNPIPNKSSSVPTLTFDGDKSLTNDAYKIYLVKKYGIEKNEALGKFIVSDKLFNSIEEALSYVSVIEETPISSQAQNTDSQNLNHQNRKIIDSEDALNYGITLNNGKFIYKNYSYDNFQDAINYAKSDLLKISQTTKSDLSSSPSFSGDDDLKKFGIVNKDGSFLFKNLSFGNRQDAINYAKSALAKGSVESVSIDSKQDSISDSSLKNQVVQDDNLTKNGLIICSIVLLIGVPYYFYKTSEEKKLISSLIAKSNQAFYECHNKKIKSSCAAQTKLSKELTEKGYCWSRADFVWFKCSR